MRESRSQDESKRMHTLRSGSEKKLCGLLGFAARARKLICGADLCRDSIRRGQLPLALIASDASENTVKRITDACRYYDTDMCHLPIPSSVLSKQIGKTASIAVIGVTDMNFVKGIAALFEDESPIITVPKG